MSESESSFRDLSDEASASSTGSSTHGNQESVQRRAGSSSRRPTTPTSARPHSATSSAGLHRGRVRLTDYRDLLNTVIAEVSQPNNQFISPPLPSSQIGASFWSSAEKELFFSKLAILGRHCLPGLSQAIQTKSEPEVRVYLDLLDQGVAEADATLKVHDGFTVAHVLAANEIGAECEAALNVAADALGEIVQARDAEVELQRYGQYWLIDQDGATQLDEQAERDHEHAEQHYADVSEEEDERHSSFPPSLMSAKLLRPSAFIQLSTNLFMNGPLGNGANWRDHVKEDQAGPAIFRTALDDFYNLVVSLTRRLVQTTLFQTMSRLRANDTHHSTWRPVEAVSKVDVDTAIAILGMDTKLDRYWAQAPRRCRVNVVSTSSKYRDGREGTKSSVSLSYDEVDAALDTQHHSRRDTQHHELQSSEDPSHDQEDLDSDWYTDVTVSDASDAEFQPNVAGSIETGSSDDRDSDYTVDDAGEIKVKSEDTDSDDQRDPRGMKQSQRTLSPRSHCKAEDEYMNSIDHHASVEEECRLWAILGKPPVLKSEAVVEEPCAPSLKRSLEGTAGPWTSKVQYQAEWERFDGVLPHAAFEGMEQQGREKRIRRMERRQQILTSDEQYFEDRKEVLDFGRISNGMQMS